MRSAHPCRRGEDIQAHQPGEFLRSPRSRLSRGRIRAQTPSRRELFPRHRLARIRKQDLRSPVGNCCEFAALLSRLFRLLRMAFRSPGVAGAEYGLVL